MNHTDNFAKMGSSFCVKARNPEWGSSGLPNLLVLKLLIQTWNKIEKSERSSLKEKEWLMAWEPSKYSFRFCAIGWRCLDQKRTWKRQGIDRLGWKTQAKRLSQHRPSPLPCTPPKSVRLECQQRHSAQRASCHNKLIDKSCHWFCFFFHVLLRGCIRSATYVNWGLLPDLGDQFCQSWLMDRCVAATAWRIPPNAFSNTLRNYMLDLQRGRYRCICVAH